VEELGCIPEQRKSGYLLHTYGSEDFLNYLDQLEKASERISGAMNWLNFSKTDFLKNFIYFKPLDKGFQAKLHHHENAFVFFSHRAIKDHHWQLLKLASTFKNLRFYKTAKEQVWQTNLPFAFLYPMLMHLNIFWITYITKELLKTSK